MVKNNQKRKQWRKAKIEDVEEALEDDRLINKLKRKSLNSKASTDEVPELFTVDTAGSCEGLSGASRRAIARAKIFPPKGPNLGLTATEEAKIARAENKLAAARASKRRAVEPEVFDLWAEPTAPEKARLATEREEQRASTVRRVTQNAPSRAPKTLYQKVSAAPAVLPAHEGQSMNPEAKAFEDVACIAAARELERERENEALDRKLRPMTAALRDVAGTDAVKDMDEEAKVRTFRAMACPTAVAAEEAGGDEEGPAVETRKNKQKIKAQAQRNREKKRKIIDAKQDQIRAQKKLERSVGELGAIHKELNQKAEWEEGRREYKKSMRQQQKQLEAAEGIVPKGRKLGRTKFIEETVVVPDAEAASKGLRAMPLRGGTAVHERISSIMRRGMLPAPPEASRQEVVRRKKKISKLRKGRKFISPLLRDNVLLQRR